MDKKRFAELYGNFELFLEAFTAVEKGSFIQDDTKEKMNVYSVTFNENEFMSFKELCELSEVMKQLAEKNGIDMFVYDVGIDSDEEPEGIINAKIRKGTNDFYIEPAMSEEETLKAINLGINLVKEYRDKNYDIILTGEMGIGNTTTSAAVCSAIFGIEATDKLTGRGAGLDDEKFFNKKRIIRESIEKYSLKFADAFTILSTVGGFDIAALTGVCLGGAMYGVPIVLDGVITMTAGLAAEKICPGVKDYLILSHKGKEPASEMISDALGLKAVIDGDMALGEGTGAVMMLSLLEDALCVYNNAARFSEIAVDNYERFS